MISTTQVPNIIFDQFLPELKESELKILLVIVRQTLGWINTNTGERKSRDWISRAQFMNKTGLSRKVVSNAIHNLSIKGLIKASCQNGNILTSTKDRKGKQRIFYSLGYFLPQTSVKNDPSPGYNTTLYKRNPTKENLTKERRLPIRQNPVKTIGQVIDQSGYRTIIWP